MSALFQSLQMRRSAHEPLLSLAGRLELIRCQLEQTERQADTQLHIQPQARWIFHVLKSCLLSLYGAERLCLTPCLQVEYVDNMMAS